MKINRLPPFFFLKFEQAYIYYSRKICQLVCEQLNETSDSSQRDRDLENTVGKLENHFILSFVEL